MSIEEANDEKIRKSLYYIHNTTNELLNLYHNHLYREKFVFYNDFKNVHDIYLDITNEIHEHFIYLVEKNINVSQSYINQWLYVCDNETILDLVGYEINSLYEKYHRYGSDGEITGQSK